MVNETSLTLRPIARSGASGNGRIVDAETSVNTELVEFAENDKREVLVRRS